MKYATIDTNGNPTGFYDEDVHKTIPAGAVEISDADWLAHINGDLRRWDGQAWVGYAPPPHALTFEERNADVLAQIEALDKKRIRPLAEGDTAYLNELNAQITALRAKLI